MEVDIDSRVQSEVVEISDQFEEMLQDDLLSRIK